MEPALAPDVDVFKHGQSSKMRNNSPMASSDNDHAMEGLGINVLHS
jgi:hypothetical protein